MRMTSTTSVPVSAKEMTAAGPAEPMTTPLPTKRPAPMTPPRAIICMCRRRSERRNPLESRPGTGVLMALLAESPLMAPASGELLVFLEVPHRLRQRIAAEGIPERLCHEHLEHRGAARALRGGRRAQRGPDVGEPLDRHAIEAEGARHGRPARVVEVHSLVAPRVEVD